MRLEAPAVSSNLPARAFPRTLTPEESDKYLLRSKARGLGAAAA